MADFFGGILDDLRGYATDAASFFDTSLGRTLFEAGSAGFGGSDAEGQSQKDNSRREMWGGVDGRLSQGQAIQSEDFSAAEARWINRMKAFANLDTGTTVKLKD